jgi:hypothetical protein
MTAAAGARPERRRRDRSTLRLGNGRRAPRAIDGAQTERLRLIEFVWTAPTGTQRVLLVDREFLH